MTCSGAYATAQDYEDLLCTGNDLDDAETLAAINRALALAVSDVHAALASVDACDCTLATWAEEYVKKLNIIDAAVIQNCPCGNQYSDAEKRLMLEWLDKQFELIRTGKIEVCQGHTGSQYPAWGTIQTSLTPWAQSEIALNEILKQRA